MKFHKNLFSLKNKTAVITGGAGLLGEQHANAIIEAGGKVIIFDNDQSKINKLKKKNIHNYNRNCIFFKGSVNSEENLNTLKKFIIKKKIKINILINNAALNPKLANLTSSNKVEAYSLNNWNDEISVSLTGTFLTSKIIGSLLLKNKSGGSIINVSSDLGLISPDNRIYNNTKKIINVKPISYSVIKHGIIGLTKYLATYWGDKKIRTNCLCPGGVYENHNKQFVKKISNLIPLKRMANIDEYKGAIQFLSSNASSYMNGANLVIDGGRSIW
jgi:NAD(P)-dependent dehydrogenase (short-subunit alcohol dehydrogenase family)